MKTNPLYKTTNNYDKIVSIGDIEQHVLNNIAYPPNDKELVDLAVLIKNSGLIDPIEVDVKDKKTIWSGHRRYRTLIKKFKVSEVPIKYVNVPEFDNKFDELRYLVERNVRREEAFIDKYNYLKWIFTEFKKVYGNDMDDSMKEYNCKLKGISLDLYKKAQDVEYSGKAHLWKKIEKGSAVTTVWKEWKDGKKSKDRKMNPSIISYLKEKMEILKEALSETASYMTSLANQERRDLEKSDGSTHKPFLKIQPNIIGGMIHEELTS